MKNVLRPVARAPKALGSSLFALALLAACGGTQAAPDCPVLAAEAGALSEPETASPALRPADATLNAVVWMQTSVEYAAGTMQVYRDAARALEAALEDPTWTASPEQVGTDYEHLPPAIILDLDETVIDNSAYQAWLIQTNGSYDRTSWNAWCDAADAAPVPGALEFLQHADALGVALFYVTNRYGETREGTLRNLEALGVPLQEDGARLLMRGEQPDWTSEKGTRRVAVGETHRIVQLIGDNFGDFLDDVETSVDARRAFADAHEAWWGSRWFMLPNPQYGSWESAALHDSGASGATERHEMKILRLWAWDGPPAEAPAAAE